MRNKNRNRRNRSNAKIKNKNGKFNIDESDKFNIDESDKFNIDENKSINNNSNKDAINDNSNKDAINNNSNKDDKPITTTNKIIVLDIDGTLISSETILITKDLKLEIDKVINNKSSNINDTKKDEVKINKQGIKEYHLVIRNIIQSKLTDIYIKYTTRPHLNEFLTFCSTYFKKVIIWSAGTRTYVDSVVEQIFRGIKPPDHIFNFDHCEVVRDDNGDLISYSKPLRKLFDFGVIIDDSSSDVDGSNIDAKDDRDDRDDRDNKGDKGDRDDRDDRDDKNKEEKECDDEEIVKDDGQEESVDSKNLLKQSYIGNLLNKVLIIDDIKQNFDQDNPHNGILIPEYSALSLDYQDDECLLQLIEWLKRPFVINNTDVKYLYKDDIFDYCITL